MKANASKNLLARICFCLLSMALVPTLVGCSDNVAALEPSGLIARTIDDLFWITVAVMSIVMIPVFVMTVWFAWKYRASNAEVQNVCDEETDVWFEWAVWLLPILIILVLASMSWIYTHRLDPYKPLTSTSPALEIQVIALDWKWLFVYPEQNIAVVNELYVPTGRPITFKITSNTVMNSFFVPRLGGQIFAMAGMETQLHLVADQPGHYFGENIQYSGLGFADQSFEVHATSLKDFDAWITRAKQSSRTLDLSQFNALAKPSVKHPVTYYFSVAPGLFRQVLDKFKH